MTSHVDCWGLSVPPNAKGQGIHWSGEERGRGGGVRGREGQGEKRVGNSDLRGQRTE